ncbi:MAG TPA: TIGR03435 family protein [Bryobacteraceae bacterium]|jgi:uncharacterized protein (TIGR03435 family)
MTRSRLLIPLAIALLLCAARRAHAQSPAEPAWQAAAGHKMSFDTISLKPATPGKYGQPAFALTAGDSYTDTGVLTGDFQLSVYIQFAWKLTLTVEQRETMLANLPSWVKTDRFTIEAHASGHPTKDQMRLMMQSLLADRFKMTAHLETRQQPIFALTVVTSGQIGKNLIPHSDGPPCDVEPPPLGIGMSGPGSWPKIWPLSCDGPAMLGGAPSLLGFRNTTMELLAGSLATLAGAGRPVVDRTGLSGRFDYRLEFTVPRPAAPTRADTAVGPNTAPTLQQAIIDQLGLKLEPTEGPVEVLVVDHVEKPVTD